MQVKMEPPKYYAHTAPTQPPANHDLMLIWPLTTTSKYSSVLHVVSADCVSLLLTSSDSLYPCLSAIYGGLSC